MHRAAAALGALTAVVVLILLPPLVLAGTVGTPWPAEGISLSAPLSDGAVIDLLALVGWLLWLQTVWCLVVETVAGVTVDRVVLPHRLTFAFERRLARRLVGVLLTAAVAAPALTTTPYAAWATPAPVAASDPVTTAPAQMRRDEPAPAAPAQTAGHHEVEVRRFDTLWSIAERELGAGERYVDIAALNEGRPMTDGTAFRSADLIRPGWVLRLPSADPHTHGGRGVVVEPGDSLTSIARDHMGDATAAVELFESNRAVRQPDGSHLTDPDLIRPGWVLHLPRRDDGPARSTHPQPAAPQTVAPQTAPPTPAGPVPTPSVPVAPTSTTTTPGTAPSVSSAVTASVAPPATPPPPTVRPTYETSRPTATPDNDRPGDGVNPESVTDQDDDAAFPWVFPAFMGGGAFVAGAFLIALRARRRARDAARRSGHAFISTDPALRPVEKSARIMEPAATLVARVDASLADLMAWATRSGVPLPALAAVEVAPQVVTFHLAAPADMPENWVDSDGRRTTWRPPLLDSVDVDAVRADGAGPYPLLVSIGGRRDTTWLLNLEECRLIHVEGEPSRVDDFLRHVVFDIAVEPWGELSRVTVVGLDESVACLGPERVDTPDLDTLADTMDTWRTELRETVERCRDESDGVARGRTGAVDHDAWPGRLLVLAHGAGAMADEAVVEFRNAPSGQTGAALVSAMGPRPDGALGVEIDAAGHLVIAQLGLELEAVQLSAAEARSCGDLLASVDDDQQVRIPTSSARTSGRASRADAAGAIRADLAMPRPEEEAAGDASLLPLATADYAAVSGVSPDDVVSLAPVVEPEVAADVLAADPHLDDDVADWFDPACRRPRLMLLGPVTVKAYGRALDKRKPYFTEMLTYLALRRRHGVTPAELADAFGVEVSKIRIYINTVREWLGRDLETGELHLPHADKAPSARLSGVPVYQVSRELLIDTDLFARLRTRGQARGAAGITDLERALDLVRGAPFTVLRPGGWSWLLDGERIDLYATHAVVDAATIVALHYLAEGSPTRAEAAARIARETAPDEEATQRLWQAIERQRG